MEDLSEFTTESYTALSKDLKDDVDRAFSEGEEVRLVYFPSHRSDAHHRLRSLQSGE